MSWVEQELREQPAALARLLAAETDNVLTLAGNLVGADVHYLLIASRGSSGNAARYAQYLLGTENRLPVSFATPSLYTLYDAPPRLEGALAIGISQSGASPDVVAVLAEARSQGRPTLAITNEVDSPLARAAEWTLPLHAGEERAVAATKTYLNSIACIALLSAALAGNEAHLRALHGLPAVLTDQIERSLAEAERLDPYREAAGGSVVARGVNYGTAFEIALKIRELSGLLFEAYSSADLMHGPVAAIGEGWPVLAVAPRGPAFEPMTEALDALKARRPRLLVISDDERALARADVALPLWTRVPEWLSPLLAVVPGQIAAMRLAQLRSIDLDSPLGLSKVTLTR